MSQPSILSSSKDSNPSSPSVRGVQVQRPRIVIPGNQSPHSPLHYNNNPLYIAPLQQIGGGAGPPQPPMTPVTPWIDPFGRYPTKASEFMFKQFTGFKDFTMNTAKSGLSVGEKFAFWMYNKISTWSRKWFTHMFLFVVIFIYSIVGAFIFVAVEGPHEQNELKKIRVERVELIKQLWELSTEDIGPGPNPEERRIGQAVSRLREFENHVITNYLKGVRDKGEIHADWTFWNAVFYCGTIYTTIAFSLATMASEDTSLNIESEQNTSPAPLTNPANNSVEQNMNNNEEKSKLESMVTPEQVLSASVARKRRNVTKKRSQSSGGKLPRDKTPVRELPPNYNDDDENDETTNKQTDVENTPPSRPERRRSREIKPNDLTPTPKPKEEQAPEEVLKLLNTAKRSLSSHSSERQSRKTSSEKKAIIKRSKSAPREFPIDDADLIESFKKAQQLSIEVGTANLKVNYTASDEDSAQTSSITSEEDKSNLIKEKSPPRVKEKLIKPEVKQPQPKLSPEEKEQQESEQYTTESTSDEEKYKTEEDIAREKEELKQKLKLIKKAQQESKRKQEAEQAEKERLDKKLLKNFLKEIWLDWKQFTVDNSNEYKKICSLRNRCISHIIFLLIFCGIGGFIFRFTEGAFETFYKCGVKRVKRDFIDSLWYSSHNMREEDWKSMARRKLMEFEDQLHEAHEAGVHSYSGQRSWSFLNAVIYCLTVVTTIGYGHITPSTTTGRAITIIYAIFGIPMFLILLADFGKLFTRCIKFVWAFVRRLYYTGSCRKVRKTETVQDVMKGVQMVYDIATFRRPSQVNMEDIEIGQQQQPQTVPLGTPPKASSEGSLQSKATQLNVEGLSINQGIETPNTPLPSNFAIDDEFNLPVSVAIVILVIYLLGGASIYCLWENWTFFESFYFVFISMSTIGFGDFVPQHPMYMMASIMYLVFGLALTSMCINVVQVKLSDTFRQASAKIGATIGLMAEDEMSFTNPMPTTTEIAEVHTAGKKESDKKK